MPRKQKKSPQQIRLEMYLKKNTLPVQTPHTHFHCAVSYSIKFNMEYCVTCPHYDAHVGTKIATLHNNYYPTFCKIGEAYVGVTRKTDKR